MSHEEALAVIARIRKYVDDPGNWSAYDGRPKLLLALLDNKLDDAGELRSGES